MQVIVWDSGVDGYAGKNGVSEFDVSFGFVIPAAVESFNFWQFIFFSGEDNKFTRFAFFEAFRAFERAFQDDAVAFGAAEVSGGH